MPTPENDWQDEDLARRTPFVKRESDETPRFPHGSVVEQVHRILTTDQGVDPWTLAEEIVKFVRARSRQEAPEWTI